jgi:hypothetical protein
VLNGVSPSHPNLPVDAGTVAYDFRTFDLEFDPVIVSPRALIGVAPAVVVLVGSFWMSRNSARPEPREDGSGSHSEVMTRLTPEDEDRLHRVALKEETIDDLIDRRVSLAEAVDRFEMLAGPVAFLTNPGETPRERAVWQIMSYIRKKFSTNLDQVADRLAELESEAQPMEHAAH